MEKQPGRKALIVLSDGVDMGSKESLEVGHRVGPAGQHHCLFHPVQR